MVAVRDSPEVSAASRPRIAITPVTIKEAKRFVKRVHRHNPIVEGGLFAIACSDMDDCEGSVIGVAIVGRPKARVLQDGWTAEITRVAVMEGYRNACSMLYSRCVKIAFGMGYQKVITYTLVSEKKTVLKAAGWPPEPVAFVKGRSWTTASRPRVDKHEIQDRFRWEITSNGSRS